MMTPAGCIGDVDCCVLILVRELEPGATGAAIQYAAAGKFKGPRSWQGSAASVYRALNHLESIGCVTFWATEPKRGLGSGRPPALWTLTDQGREVLAALDQLADALKAKL